MALLFAITLIPLTVSDVSAKCAEDERCLGTPIFRTLKSQVHHYPLPDITCANQDHLLVERPNGELACVSESMAEKTGWYIHYENKVDMRAQAAIWANGIMGFAYFEITGAEFDQIVYQNQRLVATVIPNDESGLLSLDLPFGVPSGSLKYCNSNNMNPPNAPFVVIIDDIEYEYHEEKNSRGQSALNIPLDSDSETIEILRTCFDSQEEFLIIPQNDMWCWTEWYLEKTVINESELILSIQKTIAEFGSHVDVAEREISISHNEEETVISVAGVWTKDHIQHEKLISVVENYAKDSKIMHDDILSCR